MTSALFTESVEPLRADPTSAAVLLDIDGTLAPIVEHAEEATVPEITRQLLIAISRRYGLLACISGRRASEARAMVGVGTIAYLGSHGAELMEPGGSTSRLDAGLLRWAPRIDEFRRASDTGELRRRHVRIEDKGPIIAYHWRGAADPQDARDAVDVLAGRAKDAGFDIHWGRMVMEVRPPVRIDKGLGVRTVLAGRSFAAVLYVGDDVTDIDAFRAVRELVGEGTVQRAVCVGVRSEDGPAAIVQDADITVDGTDGVRALLTALVAE